MIWQVARVLARDGDRVTLVFAAPEQCERCARGEGCGAGVFARLFGRRETRVALPVAAEFLPDEWVRVGLAPGRLAVAATLHYGLPLAGFLVGAVAGHAATSGGAAGDLLALGGGIAGFAFMVAFVGRRLRPSLNPVVERLSCRAGDSTSCSR